MVSLTPWPLYLQENSPCYPLVRRLDGPPEPFRDGNIEMNLKENECGDVDWIHLTQDRNQWQVPVNVIMNLWVP
jgi:hypothetical protein